MKQFNRIIIFIVFVWLLLAVLSPLLLLDDGSGRSKEYLVEINRLQVFFYTAAGLLRYFS